MAAFQEKYHGRNQYGLKQLFQYRKFLTDYLAFAYPYPK